MKLTRYFCASFLAWVVFFVTAHWQPVLASTCTWQGGVNSNWETAGNWSGCNGVAPTTNDDVVISSNVTVNINGTTTINSLTLGNGSNTPTLNFGYDAISSGALIIDDGNLTVNTGAIITHTTAFQATIGGRVSIDVETGSATIAGTINVNDQGYDGGDCTTCGGYGTGAGSKGESAGGAGGAGHGGPGGNKVGYTSGVFGVGGTTYGSSYRPTTLGSGGGAGKTGGGTNMGGDGGGAIYLQVGNTLTVSGSITANGGVSTGIWENDRSGAGAGGSITILTNNLAGNGTISANGGNATTKGGNGGGGRIGVEFTGSNSFSGSISVAAGSGTGGSATPGTSYIEDTTNNDLTIPSDNYSWTKQDRTSDWTFRNITVNGDWTVESTSVELFLITLTGSMNLADNVTITFKSYASNDTDGVGVYFKLAGDLTIPATSGITADGGGYAGGAGGASGAGTGKGVVCAGSDGGRGGGYGGIGGGTVNASTYGSVSLPIDLGSGGSGGCGSGSAAGGRGGGAIRINTAGTLTVNGLISANGQQGRQSFYGGGGGSGGSILLTVGTLAGSGEIEAIGGAGGVGTNGSASGDSGGGGRISLVYYTANNWAGQALNAATSTAPGTVANGGLAGGNGTVSINDATPGYVVNLDASLDAVDSSTWVSSLEIADNAVSGTNGIGVKNEDNRIADFTLYFDGNRSLASVTADSDPATKKAFFHVPGGYTNIDGYDMGYADFALYVPRNNSDSSVYICPGVDDLVSIESGCSNKETYTASDDNVSVVTIDGQKYWRVTGLTGSGGASVSTNTIPDTSSFSLTGAANVYGGTAFNLTSEYYDADGAADLDQLFLNLKNPDGTDITYYATQGSDSTGLTPTASSGSDYISSITYDRSSTGNVVTITWHITLTGTWTPTSSLQMGMKAIDDSTDETDYVYASGTYSYATSAPAAPSNDSDSDNSSNSSNNSSSSSSSSSSNSSTSSAQELAQQVQQLIANKQVTHISLESTGDGDQPLSSDDQSYVEVGSQKISLNATDPDSLHFFPGQSIRIKIPASAIEKESTEIENVFLSSQDNAYRFEKINDIYQVDFKLPEMKGAFEAKVITVYSDDTVSQLTISYSIDPYGYVYVSLLGYQVRLKDAEVTLLTRSGDQIRPWTAKDDQKNPQLTNKNGEYSFFVEPGDYQIVVKKSGFMVFTSSWFKVESQAVQMNINLTVHFGIIILTALGIGIPITAGGFSLWRKNIKNPKK